MEPYTRSPKPADPLPRTILASALLHALILAPLLPRHPQVAPMRLPGTRHGSRIELAYLPGRAPVRTSVPNPRSHPQQVAARTPQPALSAPPARASAASPNTTSPTSAQPDSPAGTDALGDGNVSIATVAFFPPPKPDLSPLAHGAAGDVILDVIIDASGKISDIKMTRGLGHGIDETVIAAVQQWTFRPATKDGQPIPSEQELHFHYERS